MVTKSAPQAWKAVVLAAFLLMVAAFSPALATGQPPEPEGEFVPGRLLVSFKPGIAGDEKRRLHESVEGRVSERLEHSGIEAIELPNGRSLGAAMARYRNSGLVEYAEPDFILRASVIPNDPHFGSQWALRNTGQTVGGAAGGTSDADIDAGEASGIDAWSVRTNASNVVVAVIDTGVDITHPDLSDNKWINTGEVAGNSFDDDRNGKIDDINGWDFANSDSSVVDVAETCDAGGYNDDHGTHIAGIIGAEGNNAVGVAGIAWAVKIMPLKFLEKSGTECAVGNTSKAVEAIDYARLKGAHILNLSFGGSEPSIALRDALLRAQSAGIMMTSAAGNGGADRVGDNLANTPDYPSSFNLDLQVVTISSTRFDTVAASSNFGGASDVAAPGERILSTLVANSYGYYSGTSMAAPTVAGVLALLKAHYPTEPSASLIARLYSTVELKPAFGGGKTTTGGRINADRALRGANTGSTTSNKAGYWLVAKDGGIFTFGNIPFYGSTGGMALKRPILGMAVHPSGNGYWLVAEDGGIFTFGGIPFYGSTGAMTLKAPIVGMAVHPSGNGYWLVASDGGIFTFGNIPFYGSTGAMTLKAPIVGMAVHPSGRGYWLVASDGGIFTFGNIPYHGSTGAMTLKQPIVGMAAHPSGNGYWLVASDGGIFTFGNIPFHGSTGAMTLNQPIVGMSVHPTGAGYWLVASDGGIFTFGSIPFYGSTGGMRLNQPIVGMDRPPL